MPGVLGRIYFIQAEVLGYIKIGWTENLAARLASLRQGSPVPLRPLGAAWGTKEMEHGLHRVFAEERVHGEWFLPSPVLLKYINDHIEKWPENDGVDRPTGLYLLYVEGTAQAWIAPYTVKCRLCSFHIAEGVKGYCYERQDGDWFDACAGCSLGPDGEPRKALDLKGG